MLILKLYIISLFLGAITGGILFLFGKIENELHNQDDWMNYKSLILIGLYVITALSATGFLMATVYFGYEALVETLTIIPL